MNDKIGGGQQYLEHICFHYCVLCRSVMHFEVRYINLKQISLIYFALYR